MVFHFSVPDNWVMGSLQGEIIVLTYLVGLFLRVTELTLIMLSIIALLLTGSLLIISVSQ